mmetsp:Transcript_20136/g.28865  ORF Transcript_20136/g.28865 Transcript_20136/m.28865 type:complete len:398 (-) Transcript_20136:83-1276(-)
MNRFVRFRSFVSQISRPTVAVAMSGGIDSSAVAVLLKNQGYDVVGVFMRNWDASDEVAENVCQIDKDRIDMREVCNRLQIPYHEVDFVKEYWVDVFTPFLESYKSGILTPNPDVFCNRFIKFFHLKKYISENLGISTLATGHYARIVQGKTSPELWRGVDPIKDQSYFLSLVNGKSLQDVLMPLGNYHKNQVREIVAEPLRGLAVLQKKESMGICFIGKRPMSEFLSRYMPLKRGRFIDMDTGKVVGRHSGCEVLTVGQRARIGGCPEKYYIASKAVQGQPGDVYVVPGVDHPALFTKSVTLSSHLISWIAGHPPPIFLQPQSRQDLKGFLPVNCSYKVRSVQPPAACTVTLFQSDAVDSPEEYDLRVDFFEPQRAVSAGQILVLYLDEQCLGGAVL